ncbi:MAG: single-stranded DNA-binding protein [Tepidiformaceae bacterium]
MPSLNKVMLIGNLGRDPEMRYTANGTAQTQFSLAVSRNFRGPDGEWKEETEWFNVVAWRDLAERLSQNLTKGQQVYVEGRLQTRNWDDDQGVKHYRTEVIANSVMSLGRREGGGRGATDEWSESAPPARSGGGFRGAPAAAAGGDIDPDDLPFE